MYNIWLVLAIAHYIWTMEEWWRWWAKARRERQEGYTKKKRRSAMAIYFNASKQKAHSLAPPSHVNVSSMSVKWAEQRSISGIIIIIISSYFFGLPSLFSSLFVLCFLFPFFFVLLLALLARRHIERVCVCAQLTSAMHSPGLEGGGAFPALSTRVPWDVVASIEPTHKWMSKAGRS